MTENVKIYCSFDRKEEHPERRISYVINVNKFPRIVDVKPDNHPALEWLAEQLVRDFSIFTGARVYLWDQEQTYLGCVDVDVVNVPSYQGQYVEESEE